MNVGIEKLAEAINKEMENYSEEIEEIMHNHIDEVSDELLEEMKNDPVIPEKTGKYKKSFYIKKEASGRGYKRNRLANKKYQLTHLLEDGHAINGGTKRTKAFTHWGPAEKRLEEKMGRIEDKL